jgi:hypothetical protein
LVIGRPTEPAVHTPIASALDPAASQLVIDQPAPLAARSGAPVQTWPDTSGRVRAGAYRTAEGYDVDWPGLARYSFSSRSLDVCATPVPGAAVREVRDTYERLALPLVWTLNGGEALHAAAVCAASGVALICARSGTGKSTLAFALAARGAAVLADDGVLLRPDSGAPVAYPAARTIRLRESSARFFAIPPGTGLTIVPDATVPVGRPGPVTGIIELRRSGRGCLPGIVRLDGGAALPAVLEHAHAVDPSRADLRRRSVDHYLHMLAHVPVWRLVVPTDYALLDAAIDMLHETVLAG